MEKMEILARYKGKVGVITGGAKGIGAAIAKRVIAEGGKMVIGDIDREALAAIEAELGEDVAVQYCDVRNREDVDALVQKAYDTFGGFDVMFANAGICCFVDFVDCPIELSDEVFSVNFRGCFNADQAAARAFIAHNTKGTIVNTSSVTAHRVTNNSAPYAASKAAIAQLTTAVAHELSKYEIRCNCFGPGSTDTSMMGEVARSRFPQTAQRLSIKRIADPSEQAAVACFLGSADSSYINGQAIFSDGGWSLN